MILSFLRLTLRSQCWRGDGVWGSLDRCRKKSTHVQKIVIVTISTTQNIVLSGPLLQDLELTEPKFTETFLKTTNFCRYI